jgi:hypothetical protein
MIEKLLPRCNLVRLHLQLQNAQAIQLHLQHHVGLDRQVFFVFGHCVQPSEE